MAVTADQEVPEHPSLQPSRRRPRIVTSLTAAGAIGAAWLTPGAIDWLRLDPLLPLLMLLGVAALLRVGSTLVDRLIIAAAVLAGLLLTEGLLFSFWPWGIEPVPVAGVTFTVLATFGWARYELSGARLHIPTRFRGSDAIVVGAPLATWFLLRAPLRGLNFVSSLRYTAESHDSFNHYALFDAIRHIGAYQFLRPRAAHPFAQMDDYPPGQHFLYAIFDVFRRSTTDVGDPVHEYLRFYQYQAISVCLLVLGVTWAARWIAGPFASGWHRVLVCATVAGFAVFGQLSSLFWEGYSAEALGLGLLAVAVACAARPARGAREQVIIGASLIIAIGYVYPLFLPVLFPAVVASQRISRTRLSRHPGFTAGAAVVTLAVALLPTAEAWRYPQNRSVLTAGGAFAPFSRPLSVALAVIALSALLTRSGRRAPSWQVVTTAVAGSCALAVLAELAGKIQKGTPQYYSSKFVAASLVISLCGFGAITLFLKPVRTTAAAPRWSAKRLAPGAAALLLALAVTHGLPSAGDPRPGSATFHDVSPIVDWAEGYAEFSSAQPLIAYARVAPLADGVPTVLVAFDPRETRQATMFLAVLNHQLGTMDADALDSSVRLPGTVPEADKDVDSSCSLLNALNAQPSLSVTDPVAARAMTVVERWIRSRPPGLRMAVTGIAFADLLRGFAAQNPDLRLQVINVPVVSP